MVSKVLEIKGLEKKYNSGFSLKVEHLTTEENRILVMIGPNGCGKSTLIKLINLLESPERGSIYFNGKLITGAGADKIMFRKEMAAVFQEPLLFNTSVYNNILMGLEIRGKKVTDCREIFDYLVDKLKIKNLLRRNPASLSGGEQQRVAIARALVLEPKLLLLDEPLANIDQQSREELRNDLFDILKVEGRSTIYVTHDRNEAMIIADDIAVINEGRIEQYGNKNDVFRKPENDFVAKFVGVETLVEGTVLEQKNNVSRILINTDLKGKITSGSHELPDIAFPGSPAFRNNSQNNNFPDIIPGEQFDTDNTVPGDNFLFNADSDVHNQKGAVLCAVAPSDVIIGDKVMLAIRPEDVTLFSSQMQPEVLSALNSLEGIIIGIEDTGIFKKVEVDCGFKLVSFVTLSSIERMGLKNGLKVFCAIKASSIHIFKNR
jgi:molybdopterin-binding protein